MSRSLRAVGVLVALCSLMPGSAHASGSRTGTIVAPNALTTLARVLYQTSDRSNYLVGAVLSMPANADGRAYELRATGGTTGIEDFDVYFYESLEGSGTICNDNRTEDRPGYESGWICAETSRKVAWAIVTMPYGVKGSFELRWS